MDSGILEDRERDVEPEVEENDLGLSYSIEDNPPWAMTILLGLQHYLTMFGATLSVPIILSPALCVNDSVVTGKLISTIFFVSGVATLLQACLGNRLPIVQGSSFSYLVPTFAILSLPEYQCPSGFKDNPKNSSFNGIWKIRIREIQGAIIMSSLFQIFIGFCGLVGFLLRFIGPITIAPTLILIGLSLIDVCVQHAGSHWAIAIVTMALIIICSQFLSAFRVPLPVYSTSEGFRLTRIPIFRLFPIVITILITWIFCAVLTAAGGFDDNSSARTDHLSAVLSDSPWFRIPYPGQWGRPTVNLVSVFGMLAGVIASTVESVADYYACARLSGAPPPPPHAINRGIFVEGVACFLAGVIGTGNGTTSVSENVSVVGITKVGSRRVVQIGAICMIVLALFGKFGALFSTIPQPVIGGVFVCMFGMITAVGISHLQYVDLNSVRNLFIIGFSLILGLVLPKYMESHPNAIDTNAQDLNQVVTVLLRTSVVVGGLLAFILDNIVPGTDRERGVLKWRALITKGGNGDMASSRVYDLPFGLTNKWQFSKHIPCLPYQEDDHTALKVQTASYPGLTRSPLNSDNSAPQSPYVHQTYL